MSSRHPRELSSPTPREQNLLERKKAIESADGGNLRLPADLLLPAITEAGWISGVVKTIAQGIPGLPRRFVGPPELVTALEGVNENGPNDCRGLYGDIFPEAEQFKMLAWGATLGVVCVQRIPVDSGSAPWGSPRVSFRMQTRHPRFLRYELPRDLWWIQEHDGPVCINEHADEYELFRPYGDLKPWEMAPWKAILLAFHMWRDAQFDRTRHSAMNGPILTWTGGPNTTPKNQRDAKVVLEEIERRARIALQYGEKLDVTSPPAGDLAGVYRDIIEDMKADIEIDLLGNRVMTGSKSTGFGDGEVWERMTARRIDYFASALERFEQRAVIDKWAPAQRAGAQMSILYNTKAPSSASTESTSKQIAGAVGQDQSAEVLPELVLNGAQITAVVDVITQVAIGAMPRDAAISTIATSLNISTQQAAQMLGSAGKIPVKVAA